MKQNSNAQNPFPGPISVSGFQPIFGGCSLSEFLNVATGRFQCRINLVDVKTLGLPLRFYLSYDVQDTVLGVVGNKWRHNHMAHLSFPDGTHTVFTADTGGQFGFVLSGGSWIADTSYPFSGATLTNPSSTWRLTFPDGTYLAFDGSGNLTSMVDSHGNTTTLTYASGYLTTVTEPTGREIQLAYSGGLLSTMTDPNGNVTSLFYDPSSNLTRVVGPSGCVVTYGYATPSNHHITSRTDSNGNTYSFSYDGSSRLTGVTDAESNSISYAYDTVDEVDYEDGTSSPPLMSRQRTTLTDARGKTWKYHFDNNNNLWRIIDPLGHRRHYYWDNNAMLLYASGGFPLSLYTTPDGPKDNLNNSFTRFVFDSNANLLYDIDANGMVTSYTYDAKNHMTVAYPGQANLAVQGDWVDHYGHDGHFFCAFNADGSDYSSLPSYIASVSASNYTSQHFGDDNTTAPNLIDPRVPNAVDSLLRGGGLWTQTTGDSFTVTIAPNTAKSFNLSLYTHSADFALESSVPYSVKEQTGRDIQISVTDLNGTQSFRVFNNAAGVWVTFPVRGDGTGGGHITVTLTASGLYNTLTALSAITFEPLDDHRMTYTYDATTGDLLTTTDGLGNVTTMTYNSDGTMATREDANSHTTNFYYLDTYKNLTKIEDPTSAITLMTYDLNGNVLTVEDPNSHTTTYAYDGKNRATSITDPLSHETSMEYDSNGNLAQVTDPNGRATIFTYTPSNRLSSILAEMEQQTTLVYDASGNLSSVTDPLGNETQYQYDDNGRASQVTLPDTNLLTYAYDALDRLRAMTAQNGNLSTLSNINLTGAANLVQNPGVENADPNTPTLPRNWTASPSNTWDNTVSHSGSHSLKLGLSSGTQYWSQSQIPLAPGASAVLRYWARPDGGATAGSTWAGLRMRDVTGTLSETTTSSTTLPASSSTWLQTALSRFAAPGDSQFPNFALEELRLHGSSSGTPNAWFDDVELYSLSTAFTYDPEGRLADTVTPDGALVSITRDRFGRVIGSTDPRGGVTQMAYDSLGRVTQVTDPQGNTVSYEYDAVGNLTTFTDPSGNATVYGYDDVNRLLTITYPDSTTETFTYDTAGNLHTYTNNRSQERTFAYDNANRLTSVTYNTDSTVVSFTYDSAGNVLTRTERNGDVTTFAYDDLNRVASEQRTVASSGPTWGHVPEFDLAGNRTELHADASAVFDSAHFDGSDHFDGPDYWSVPSPGFDSMNRMPAYKDRNSNETTFSYDVESRRTGITYPNGSPTPVTAATYDIVGRLMSLDTTRSSNDLLPLAYSNDFASNRVSMLAGGDTFDYRVDASNRLVEEAINRLVERSADRFGMGTVNQVDASDGTVHLLAFADDFSSDTLNADRWRLAAWGTSWSGMETRQQNGALQLAFPRGFCDQWFGGIFPFTYNYGLTSSLMGSGVEHRTKLSGDFDVQVDFSNLRLQPEGSADGAIALMVSDLPFEQILTGSYNGVFMARDTYPHYRGVITVGGSSVGDTTASTTDTSGKLRITRSGSTVNTYYWNGSSWTAVNSSYSGFSTSDLYLFLFFDGTGVVASVSFTNLVRSTPTATYPTSGTYTSTIFDAGRSADWTALSWTATVPGGASLSFQVATSSTPNPSSWSYVGPDGTAGTYFTSSGASLAAVPANRYVRYQATLAGDGTVTPTLSDVELSFAGANGSAVNLFTYDGAGNMTSKTAVTDSGSSTDVRQNGSWSSGDQINNLNQIQRQDVTPAGGPTTTYRYAWDNSGNLTSKTPSFSITGTLTNASSTVSSVSAADIARLYAGAPVANTHLPSGTTVSTISVSSFTVNHNATANATATAITVTDPVTSYTWDEDNRLTEVSLPGSITVSFTYDSLGRMLTRTHSVSGTATFEWDGMDMLREAGYSNQAAFDSAHFDTDDFVYGANTRYYIPNGELMSFEVNDVVYQVHADALGNVRAITDPSGNVVSHFEYDAWGSPLPSSNDPLNFPYTFVGSLGVRQDSDIGLYYMRQRWYDPSLGRFISRDPIGTGENVPGIDVGYRSFRKSALTSGTKGTVQSNSMIIDNLYQYASANPTRYVDYRGLSSSTGGGDQGGGGSIPGFCPPGYHAECNWTCFIAVAGTGALICIALCKGNIYCWGACGGAAAAAAVTACCGCVPDTQQPPPPPPPPNAPPNLPRKPCGS